VPEKGSNGAFLKKNKYGTNSNEPIVVRRLYDND
jgi:hypothetical protein